jgi:hypothetical protein
MVPRIGTHRDAEIANVAQSQVCRLPDDRTTEPEEQAAEATTITKIRFG